MTATEHFGLGITLMAALISVVYRINSKPPDDDPEEDEQ